MRRVDVTGVNRGSQSWLYQTKPNQTHDMKLKPGLASRDSNLIGLGCSPSTGISETSPGDSTKSQSQEPLALEWEENPGLIPSPGNTNV